MILGRYCVDTKMFVDDVRIPDLHHLQFQRWLVENGKGEHAPSSDPRGDYRVIEVMEKVRGR